MNFSGTLSSDFMKLAAMPADKKPNLINFAATDFISLRKSLIDYIKAAYTTEYEYFVESDLGMVFIELISYMGTVMSMKADMLANENMFATAKQRKSVKKLLQLLGVKMRGPLSAACDAKIEFDTSPVGASYTISKDKRTISITSPQDGGGVSYTLYKIVNGLVDDANPNSEIILYDTESDNPTYPPPAGGHTASSIYTNLALQEGAFVTDSGNFAATEGIKTIKLTKAPVIDGSIQVYINSNNATTSGVYTEVDNVYFASGTSDKIFEVLYDDDYAGTVLFGDGTVGVSPEDTASYVINYRVGGGSRGNLLPNAVNVAIGGTTNTGATVVEGVATNTTPATGGQNAETIEHAKKWAPLTYARQDRVVTLEDYTVFANTFISTFGTVGKAFAAVRKAYCSANIIDIYVLEKASEIQLQKATTNFKTQLLAALDEKKMMTDEVVIVDGVIRTLDLVTTIYIDREDAPSKAQIIAKARNKIMNYMNADNRSFGEKLLLSELNRQIFEVPEIRFSTLDNVQQDIQVDFNEIIQINNLSINVSLLD